MRGYDLGRRLSLLIPVCLAAGAYALAEQEAAPVDPFKDVRFLVGSWVGHETGAAGIGRGERVYEFILQGKYLLARNVSRFEPQEKNPRGEVHEDWAIFSYDEARQELVLREFHSEGFVNQYVRERAGEAGKKLVFVSESVENGPPGLHARVTLSREGPDAFHEVFELAPPGKDFRPLLENHWKRRAESATATDPPKS